MSDDILASLERVQRAITGAGSSQQMLEGVLAEMLDIFDVERAWLMYPCDPLAEAIRVPFEVTRPEYPGGGDSGHHLPVTPGLAQVLARANATREPVRLDDGRSDAPRNAELEAALRIRSQIAICVRPANDAPWLLGLHACKASRDFGPEAALFTAIGRRVEDGLTHHLAMETMRQSEARLRTLIDHAPEAILLFDVDQDRVVQANPRAADLFGVSVDTITRGTLTGYANTPGTPVATIREHIAKALGGELTIAWFVRRSVGG